MADTCLSQNCSEYLSGPTGQIFTSSLQYLLFAQCLITENWPTDGSACLEDLTFDYIIVGAGSAGSVLANRLSEDSCRRVLLIDEGDDPPFESVVPSSWPLLQKTQYDWQFRTENDSRACQAYKDGRCNWPRGKMLGGSSSMNTMMYVRGHYKNYDDLEDTGNTGWNSKVALQYFKKSEHLFDPELQNDPYFMLFHNYDGLLGITPFNAQEPIIDHLVKAFEELGVQKKRDLSDMINYGVFRCLGFVQNGERSSTARDFLVPARNRRNLTILKNTLAKKIVFSGKRAVGVTARHSSGREITFKATKEVIISAGSINTPQILMLSGIGPREHLNAFNIDVISDLPVGENLHDHVFFPLPIAVNKGAAPQSVQETAQSVAEYINFRTGPISDVGASEVNAFINVNGLNETFPPDIQMTSLFLRRQSPYTRPLCESWLGFQDEICQELNSINADSEILIMVAALLNPKSRGVIKLASTDSADHPKIYANYFAEAVDLVNVIKGSAFMSSLIKTPSFQKLGAEIIPLRIPLCENFNTSSIEYIECAILNTATTLYHPMGTCKMGPASDPNAVVDPELRVYGVKNLRVVDASIFPEPIAGNINAPTIMVAERAADLIKGTHRCDDKC